MVELVDTPALEAGGKSAVRVRPQSGPPTIRNQAIASLGVTTANWQVEMIDMSQVTQVPAPIPTALQDTVYLSFSAEITQITAEALLVMCGNLMTKGVKTVYLLLSSPGGAVSVGINAYNVLRGMPFKLITHNVGSVDSIANVIFLAGETRYSCPHASFMFHGAAFALQAGMPCDEKFLRERLQGIQSDHRKIGAIIANRTGIPVKEVEKMFLEAQTRDPNDAKTSGIIHDIRDAKIPNGATFHQFGFKRQ